MIKLQKSLLAWRTPDFENILKNEIAQLSVTQLPLQQGLAASSYTNGDNLKIIILQISDDPDLIQVKAGIFYSGIISGCNCADDPTPVGEVNEYCEIQLDINKTTAVTTVQPLSL